MKTLFAILTTIALFSSQWSKAFCQTPFPLGLKPTPHGIRHALPLSAHPDFKVEALPKAASLKQYFDKTDQRTLGICGPFSAMEAYDCEYQQRHGGRHMLISPLDVYQRVLVAQGNFPNDEGVDNDVLLRVLKTGSLRESTFPFDPAKLGTLPKDTATARRERQGRQVLKGYVIPSNDNGASVRRCIATLRTAPIIGTLWYQNGFTTRQVMVKTKDEKGVVVTTPRFIVDAPKGNPVGGHDLPAVAYDDNMVFPSGEVGGVDLHNHWQGWGDVTGSAWAPASWIYNPKFVDDCLALETVDR